MDHPPVKGIPSLHTAAGLIVGEAKHFAVGASVVRPVVVVAYSGESGDVHEHIVVGLKKVVVELLQGSVVIGNVPGDGDEVVGDVFYLA